MLSITKSFHQSFFPNSSEDLKIEPSIDLKMKPEVEDLGFGKHFTDHMLRIKWTATKGWGKPVIGPLQDFRMHPAAKVFYTFSTY